MTSTAARQTFRGHECPARLSLRLSRPGPGARTWHPPEPYPWREVCRTPALPYSPDHDPGGGAPVLAGGPAGMPGRMRRWAAVAEAPWAVWFAPGGGGGGGGGDPGEEGPIFVDLVEHQAGCGGGGVGVGGERIVARGVATAGELADGGRVVSLFPRGRRVALIVQARTPILSLRPMGQGGVFDWPSREGVFIIAW